MIKIKDNSYKLIVDVFSDKKHNITVNNIYDTRTDKNWTPEQIKERGLNGVIASPIITKYGQVMDESLEVLKQTLCNNLGGDYYKYKIGFMPSKNGHWGRAFIYQYQSEV